MTHPTIEAAAAALREVPYSDVSLVEGAKAAARVILSAPPSEAEVEATWKALRDNQSVDDEALLAMALSAFLAKRLEELEGK